MELDHKSSELTTFMTPFGRYRWNRVPFGLNNAPEMFQKRMVQIFGDIPGVEIYFDDIAIAGETVEEHDKALSLLIKRAKANNVKFNSKKIQYRTNKIVFMGHTIVDGQVQPSSQYIQAIREMPLPKNKQDVLRLLGLFKYLARFIPNLSQRTALLRNLTKNDVEWSWCEVHEAEVKDLLKTISSEPVLKFFEPNEPITIQTDSSKDGLGCVLLQNNKPVAYASRTLTKSEQKWAQIEKELLAIAFACERFHYFLYGREFLVHSDHKPLEILFKRDIDDVTPRLQRMFMQLKKYPNMSIQYKPGKEMLVADCLSRASLGDKNEFDNNLSVMIHTTTRRACLSKDNYDKYIGYLAADERYCRICKYIESGWPSYHQLDDLSQMFHRYKDEMHYENGLLFKNHRLIIPTKLQQTICKWLHAPHLGIEKTLARARESFYWPGMTNDITESVKSCTVCEKSTRNNQKEPLVQESPPSYPFQRVSIDIYDYAGHGFLALIDAYSGYLISHRIIEKSARHVMELLDSIFCRYGYPTEIKSDNVPFNSREFEKYASEPNIVLKFSSPRYPQSNGLAEKAVAIAKNILKRCYEANDVEKFQYRILEYNTTPVASMKMSPSQLFFGRLVKTKLPIEEGLLVRNVIAEDTVQNKFRNKQEVQKHYYNKHAKQLSVLSDGEKIIFKKNGKEWKYGKIVRRVNDRSYIIVDDFDNHFRRNRKFIVKTQNNDFNPGDVLLGENPINGPASQNIVTPAENVGSKSNNKSNNNMDSVQDTGPLAAAEPRNVPSGTENVIDNHISEDVGETVGSERELTNVNPPGYVTHLVVQFAHLKDMGSTNELDCDIIVSVKPNIVLILRKESVS